jgi:hypothetical protein
MVNSHEPEARGGSDWLDSVLYDEVHYSGSESDVLCDLVHQEFMRLHFADDGGSSDR